MNFRKKKFLCICVLLMVVMLAWILWANTALECNTITVANEKIPDAFDGYRIAHISDLHGAEFGQDNEKLLALLRDADPDIIAITGDLMDQRMTDTDAVLNFAAGAATIASCYYITGNHEVRLPAAVYRELMDGLKDIGVTVLEDEAVLLERSDQYITLVGHAWGPVDQLDGISEDSGFRILLSHPPEDIQAYADAGYDLVLSGHAHGGQFRLPIIGGVYAPGQGFFPEYDSGLYAVDYTAMVVSRGLGNSSIPLRINNRPEVILVVLRQKS